MPKKRRGSKRAKAKPAKRAKAKLGKGGKPKGLDFGCLPYAMAMSSFEFPNDLSDASIIGVGYGQAWSPEVGQVLPSITLVAQKPEALRRAFDTFHAWAKATDADSLEVTIVLRPAGGYLMALSPEVRRLERRCLGFDRAHQVMLFMATWCKPIDSVHPYLRKIQEYSKRPISPYLFGGATVGGQRDPKSPPNIDSIQAIPGLEPLLKFSITIVEEAEVKAGTAGSIALRIAQGQTGDKHSSSKAVPLPSDIAARRRTMLRTHFPVTLERLAHSRTALTSLETLVSQSVAPWQVEQAVCNLELSASISGGEHYQAISPSAFESRVVDALGARYELADASHLTTWDVPVVERQVLADANALLKHLDLRPAKDLAAAQTALREASVLETSSALLRPLGT